MTLEYGDTFATFEHLVPKSRGGTEVKLSHYRCNHARGNRPLTTPPPPPAAPGKRWTPKDPDRLKPFTSAWLAWKGYIA